MGSAGTERSGKALFEKIAFVGLKRDSKPRNRVERKILLSAFDLLVVPIIESKFGHFFLSEPALLSQTLHVTCNPPHQFVVSGVTHANSVAGTISNEHVLIGSCFGGRERRIGGISKLW